MIYLSEEVAFEIKNAITEEDLNEIVSKSLVNYQANRGKDMRKFVLNMIVILQAAKKEPLSDRVLRNIRFSLNIYRNHRSQNPGSIA